MTRRLPPLAGLRAFEAAARHLSFTRAAAELHVTQTAISHQIKTLEERLGFRLFRRLPRQLLLTEEGQRLLPPIRDAFDRIAEAVARLSREQGEGVLTVSVLPSFAARWLVPRLGGFTSAHPEIDLRISATSRLTDFARDDMAIRMGRGEYPGMRADRLFGETLFPVCAPALMSGPHPLLVPADLRHHTLLHGDESPGWQVWLERAGVGGTIDLDHGPRFDDSSLVLEAAIEGQGVALTRSALAALDLAAGRLIRPFDISIPFPLAYWLVCLEGRADHPRIRAFREWILKEAALQGDACE
jgi:LysR family transcriptional regulator, glycine cleavage system transcriptional activator